ncbi:hypothetical protein [Geopseudomonas aromaticivorans]
MFRKLLSEESRKKLEANRAELARMYQLPDRWLASELLRLAREAQAGLRAEGRHPNEGVYDSVFAWHILPELAKRLGATSFLAQERTDSSIVRASNEDLRFRAGLCLANNGTVTLRNSLLSYSVVNGNPVVYALDRIAAPGPDDPVAKRIWEVAKYRGVDCPDGRWSPAMLDYKTVTINWPEPEPQKAGIPILDDEGPKFDM